MRPLLDLTRRITRLSLIAGLAALLAPAGGHAAKVSVDAIAGPSPFDVAAITALFSPKGRLAVLYDTREGPVFARRVRTAGKLGAANTLPAFMNDDEPAFADLSPDGTVLAMIDRFDSTNLGGDREALCCNNLVAYTAAPGQPPVSLGPLTPTGDDAYLLRTEPGPGGRFVVIYVQARTPGVLWRVVRAGRPPSDPRSTRSAIVGARFVGRRAALLLADGPAGRRRLREVILDAAGTPVSSKRLRFSGIRPAPNTPDTMTVENAPDGAQLLCTGLIRDSFYGNRWQVLGVRLPGSDTFRLQRAGRANGCTNGWVAGRRDIQEPVQFARARAPGERFGPVQRILTGGTSDTNYDKELTATRGGTVAVFTVERKRLWLGRAGHPPIRLLRRKRMKFPSIYDARFEDDGRYELIARFRWGDPLLHIHGRLDRRDR